MFFARLDATMNWEQVREKSEELRVASLLTIIGRDLLRVYNAMVWQQTKMKTVENALKN